MRHPTVGLLRGTGLSLALAVASPSSTSAQSPVDAALRFFTGGGAYCFRVAPFGVALAQETQWTVMVLTSKSNRKDTFRIRAVDPGETRLTGAALAAAGLTVNEVWASESDRAEFFERFAAGINAGHLRARVVKAGPTNLGQLASDLERAEVYLKFTERGASISFDKVPDLKAEDFKLYDSYFQD